MLLFSSASSALKNGSASLSEGKKDENYSPNINKGGAKTAAKKMETKSNKRKLEDTKEAANGSIPAKSCILPGKCFI